MAANERESRVGYLLIGGLKLGTALLLAIAGLGLFQLLNKDVGRTLEHYASRLHLDPENRLVHEAVYRVAGIDRTQLTAIGVGTFFYAALEALEGVGLLLRGDGLSISLSSPRCCSYRWRGTKSSSNPA